MTDTGRYWDTSTLNSTSPLTSHDTSGKRRPKSSEMSKFVPDLLMTDAVIIDDFDLQCKADESGRQMFTYTVTWHEKSNGDDNGSEEFKEVEPKFSFMNASSSATKNAVKNDLDERCRRWAPSNTPKAIQQCRCDGPCGKIKPVREMRSMGLCDHTICTEGCPNVACYLTDLACLCTDRQRRRKKFRQILEMERQRGNNASKNNADAINVNRDQQQWTQPSPVSSIPCVHLVDVRATTFIAEHGHRRIQKKQKIVEMHDNYTLQEAINMLQDYPRSKATELIGFVYYCLNGRVNERASWKRIGPNDLALPLINFENADDRIDIIFDCT
uniref:CXC domain-containing protein n=1 Tax=Ascaris lumbricoides TaxID=6252 RepID=A0A9J2PTE3_ASCLU